MVYMWEIRVYVHYTKKFSTNPVRGEENGVLFNSLVCEKNTLNKPLLDGRKNKNSYIKDKKVYFTPD